MGVPWTATVRPLPQEHKDGRLYVHFAALWWWLKLGILGLAAYIGIMVAALRISFQVWRRVRDPMFSAFGLATMCGVVGLIVIDTTASFTGVDLRLSAVFAVQIGLLALLARPLELAPGND
jgi:O-antigen ligase